MHSGVGYFLMIQAYKEVIAMFALKRFNICFCLLLVLFFFSACGGTDTTISNEDVDNQSDTTELNGTPVQDFLPAFPGAEGYGAKTIGGRGGEVIKVTNLNDAGPGSFREAVTTEGPRIVVFEVSGIINLDSEINIYEPFLTIAGQTSPGGILVTGRNTRINTHEVIMQHMRFRGGSQGVSYERDVDENIIYYNVPQYALRNTGECIGEIIAKVPNGLPCALTDGADPETLDSFNVWGSGWGPNDAYNIIIDHCSFSWGIDDNLSLTGGVLNATVQWSIVSEGLSRAGHPKGEHSKGMMVSGKPEGGPANSVSLHHNYIAHNVDRSPLLYSAEDVDTTVDYVNNVTYHWKGGLSPMGEEKVKVNWIHNYAKPGLSAQVPSHPWSFEVAYYAEDIFPEPLLYVSGNIGSSRMSQTDPQWNVGWHFQPQLLDTAWKKETSWTVPAVTTTVMSSDYALEILNDVGATKPVRDSVDSRVISDFTAETGEIILNVTYPDDFPVFTTPTPPADSDNDGMADSWETTEGFNVGVDDSALDNDGDGYTNIEEYLHYLHYLAVE